jgi:hypothetical protein
LIEEVQPIIYLGSDRFNLTIGLDFEFVEDVAGVGGEVSIGGKVGLDGDKGLEEGFVVAVVEGVG